MEIIHGDKWQQICDVVNDHEIKRNLHLINDKHCIVFCKTDYLQEYFKVIAKSSFKHILISSNSDNNITNDLLDQLPSNIIHWFAQNVLIEDSRITPIPIGLERPLAFGKSSNYNIIINNVNKLKSKLIYMNHSNGTNMSIRQPIYDKYKNIDWVTTENKISFNDYINNLSIHKFTFSPNGNGLDCHRTWEALYLGVIPIVNDNVMTRYFAQYLPIITVNDMTTITKEFLEQKYNTMFNINLKVLDINYWFNLIINQYSKII